MNGVFLLLQKNAAPLGGSFWILKYANAKRSL